LPPDIIDCQNTTYFPALQNEPTGPYGCLPSELGLLTSLTKLSITFTNCLKNPFDINVLTLYSYAYYTIPPEIISLTKLTHLKVMG